VAQHLQYICISHSVFTVLSHCCVCVAAYTGLRVDIDHIRADNALRTDVERKSGLIIWSGREFVRLSCGCVAYNSSFAICSNVFAVHNSLMSIAIDALMHLDDYK
jgi:hypothetical protein